MDEGAIIGQLANLLGALDGALAAAETGGSSGFARKRAAAPVVSAKSPGWSDEKAFQANWEAAMDKERTWQR